MKLFDLDWLDFFQRLGVWNRLALRTRRVLSRLKPAKTVNAKEFGDDLQLLADAKFLMVYIERQRAKLHKDCHPFARAIRAMCRHDVLGQPDAATLQNYIEDHFTRAEQDALSPSGRNYRSNIRDLASDALSIAWLEDFLSLKNLEQAKEWESLRLRTRYYYQNASIGVIIESSEALTATQSIIRQLMSSTEPVLFGDLPVWFKDLSLPLLATATYAGIRYMLLFPSMRHGDMTPMINVWPTIPQRLHRPKPKPPRTVTPDQSFHCAYLMEDMTTVLVCASGEPPRVRGSDQALFAKAQKQLESNLTSVPEWLSQVDGCTSGKRVQAAVEFLQGLRFIETRGTQGKDLRLEPTAEARDWLGMSSRDRLKSILDRLKPDQSRNQQAGLPAKHRNMPGDVGFDMDDVGDAARFARDMLVLAELDDDDDDDYDWDAPFTSYDYDHRLRFLPRTVSWGVDPVLDLGIPAALIDTYGSLARRRFVQFSQFVEYHMQQANPLLSRRPGAKPLELHIGWSRRTPTDEEAEDLWGQLLVDFFRLRLLPLGGVQVGLEGEAAALCISLTDAGRYLLDMTKDFDYGQHSDQQGHIVVQPNFDIVFLSPAPLAEATIARFADRKATGTGTLFKITKKSIFTAASCNMTHEQVLGTLRDLCTKAIPTNVTREVRDWFDQCGRVAIKTTLLIRCPNARIATRVLEAGGKKLTPISDTVVELADRKFKTPLVNKLKETGVFVDQSSQPAVPKPKQRRRRRRW